MVYYSGHLERLLHLRVDLALLAQLRKRLVDNGQLVDDVLGILRFIDVGSWLGQCVRVV